MASSKHVTLGQIAEKADCSRSTVSRALRNHPQIPAATCKRIQALAEEMGWRPDPEASRLMQYLQQSKQGRIESALALLNDCDDQGRLSRDPYTTALMDGARERAEQLGFHLEEIWLRQPGMTPRRVDGILRARGIHGVLIPPEQQPLPSIELDWDRLAVVATTTTAQPAKLNRVLPDNYYNSGKLMDLVLESGCKRPMLITSHELEIRSEHAPTHMYYGKTQRAGLEALPVFDLDRLSGEERITSLQSLIRKHRPDYLIMPDVWVLEYLKEFSEIPWATFAVKSEDAPGIEQRPSAVGAAAVDVLSAHVIRGETGLPAIPRILHIRGEVC